MTKRMGKVLDGDSSTALAVVAAEKQVGLSAQAQQVERERLIAQCHEVVGRVQAADMFGKLATVSSLVWLQEMKDAKIYRDLPNIGTWDNFCNYLGKDRRTLDEDLQNLATFGENFLETCRQFSIGYRDLRKLRQLSHDGSVVIDAECVEIGGERIPLTPDHKEDLQAAIERVLDEKHDALEDARATVKAKDRVLKSKEDVIKRQEKELQKLSREASGRELLPQEDAFQQRMEKILTGFDGYMLKVDPAAVMADFEDGEITPRMRAALIATLGNMKMQVLSAFDTAVTDYADPSMTPEVMDEFQEWVKDQAKGTAQVVNA